jgi:Do/DeqQ family serine protease
MKARNVVLTILISALTAFAVMFGYSKFSVSSDNPGFQNFKIPANYAGFFDSKGTSDAPSDFVQASKAAIPTIVHIKTKTTPKTTSNNLPRKNPFSDLFGDDDMWDQLFGGRGQRPIVPQMASGSGVIISEDGYIITNDHVVAGADEVTVTTSDQKTFNAKVIAADPNYDLAVVKINANNLPFMLYGNSDDVEIGQWCLAIGYPLTLDVTVTAGIISAKARSLNLNRGRNGQANLAVDTYLQTDAAVNMGNSGGALINTNGQLIGINAAIASPTGYYSGYSYAIPVNIVKKVVSDLIKYGNVQRGFLGAVYSDVTTWTADQKKSQGIPESASGLYIREVSKGGAAEKANIKAGDIIKKINGVDVNSSAELQQQLNTFRPGDKVQVTYERNKKLSTVMATLQNSAGNYEIVTAPSSVEAFGAQLETLDAKKAKDYGVSGGVVVKKIEQGALNDQTRMRDGFIITKVNGKPVNNLDELKKVVGQQTQITISGIYPGYSEIFEYPLDLSNNDQ